MRTRHSGRNRFESSITVASPTRTALTVAVLLALGVAGPACAATFVVSSTADSGPGTLRQAVLDANAKSGAQTIEFALPDRSAITLTSGQLALTGPDVTVQGPGRDQLTISGGKHSRIFDVEAGSLTLNDVTLRDGLAKGDATNLYDQAGGAIRVGALPAPEAAAQFAARLQAAHAQAKAVAISAMGDGKRPRALGQVFGAMRAQTASKPKDVTPGLALTVNRVAFLDNRADAPDLSVGGAIYLEGGANLIVRDSLFSGNSTAYAGGAILTAGSSDLATPIGAGSFDIEGSSFIGNHIDLNGAEPGQGVAALIFGPGGSIRTSIFRDNVINDSPPEAFSEAIGGALDFLIVGLPITIDSSEISHNTIAIRSGVYSEGAGMYCEDDGDGITPLTVSNSTISNNFSDYGAAIEVGCNLRLSNTTIADNTSPNTGFDGPGDAIDVVYATGKFNADSTLISNPLAFNDLFLYRGAQALGVVTKSLILSPHPDTPALPADTIVGIDPLLEPLADNGGPTRTQALQPRSVAVNAGSNPLGLAFDQRGVGFARTQGSRTDIGAFELDPTGTIGGHRYPHYRLVDVGSFGGPFGLFSNPGGRVVNRRGVATGMNSTALPDPFDPNCFFDCQVDHAFAWQNGVTTDLGALTAGVSSFPYAISDRNQIVGVSQNGALDALTGAPQVHGVLWQNGAIVDLGTLGGTQSSANAINNAGQIVGVGATTRDDPFAGVSQAACLWLATTSSGCSSSDFAVNTLFLPVTTELHAVVWSEGQIHDIGTLGGPDSTALINNDRGQVVGWSYTSDTAGPSGVPDTHPFLWENGKMQDLGSLGGSVSAPAFISNSGLVTGASNLAGDKVVHPFVWSRAKGMQDLGTLGGTYAHPTWINDAGDTVGYSTTADQQGRAFYWHNGHMSNLGTLGSDETSGAYSINNRGQIVGLTFVRGGDDLNGFLSESGGPLVNLNSLIVAGPNIHVVSAVAINDSGEIVGNGTLPNGDVHAVVLVPCDQDFDAPCGR
ncbi:MAG: choice-of-anchor Q domain-containing protein [Rudaea sp.]